MLLDVGDPLTPMAAAEERQLLASDPMHGPLAQGWKAPVEAAARPDRSLLAGAIALQQQGGGASSAAHSPIAAGRAWEAINDSADAASFSIPSAPDGTSGRASPHAADASRVPGMRCSSSRQEHAGVSEALQAEVAELRQLVVQQQELWMRELEVQRCLLAEVRCCGRVMHR